MLAIGEEVKIDTLTLPEWEREAVCRGAHLLDEVKIKWWQDINLETLEFDSASNDILGQIFDNYYRGCINLNINSEIASEFGFDSIVVDIHDPELEISFHRLKVFWAEEVKERLKRCKN